LCVPECRRNRVLKLAHNSVFGGHLGERKTRESIRLSFYWPKLRYSVRQYVMSCTNCQLRSRIKTTDRVLITPVTRAEIPFQVLNMDCIGPIDPPSSQGHRYCLCIVDSCTYVYMLKSLTAKSVCNAMLDLFANVGRRQRLRFELYKSTDPRDALETRLQSALQHFWSSASFRLSRTIQPNHQEHAVPRRKRSSTSVAQIRSSDGVRAS